MIPRLWMWWKGYVTVSLGGPGAERILNQMAELKIHAFNVERLTRHMIIVRLRIRDFRRLRPLVRDAHIRASILDRHGAPFFVQRFKLRAFLVVGLLVSLALLVYLSNFIWFIEVTGNQSLSLSSLKVAVEDSGLQTGVSKHFFQPSQLEAHLLERFPELAWTQVTVKGVKAIIHVVESDAGEADYGGAGHIYATRDGVITELLVLRGTAQFQEGDTVREGDLVISGVYYDEYGQRQFGAAQGLVKGRVWYEAVGESALSIRQPVKTGQVRSQYALTIGSVRLPVGRGYPSETHLRETKEWKLPLGRSMVPISWSKTEYHAVDFVRSEIPYSEAENAAYNLAWESLTRQGVSKENVLRESKNTDLMFDAHGLRVSVRVEVLESMGRFFTQ